MIDILAIRDIILINSPPLTMVFEDFKKTYPDEMSLVHLLDAISEIDNPASRYSKTLIFRSSFWDACKSLEGFNVGFSVKKPERLIYALEQGQEFPLMALFNGLRINRWIKSNFTYNPQDIRIFDVFGLSEEYLYGSNSNIQFEPDIFNIMEGYVKATFKTDNVKGLKYESFERWFPKLDVDRYTVNEKGYYINNLYRSIISTYRKEINLMEDQLSFVTNKMEPFVKNIEAWSSVLSYMKTVCILYPNNPLNYDTFTNNELASVIYSHSECSPPVPDFEFS